MYPMNGVFSVVMAVCYMLDPISLLAGFPSVHTRRGGGDAPTPLVEQARVARPAEEIHFLLPLSWPRYEEAEPFPGNNRNRGGRPLYPPLIGLFPLPLPQKQNMRGIGPKWSFGRLDVGSVKHCNAQ